MGNFEKLGILVIIVLVMTILVLAFWGMNIPPAELESKTTLSSNVSATGEDPPKIVKSPTETPRNSDAEHSGESRVWPKGDKVEGAKPGESSKGGGEAKPDDRTPPAAPAPIEHVVKKNESLYAISVLYYRSGKYWKEILAANPGITPEAIPEGTRLKIPDPSRVLEGAPTNVPVIHSKEAPTGGRTYKVRKGDSLYRIAKRELKDAQRWHEIQDLNRAKIGSDPGNLREGMVLALPD